jgi:hypothetical protein
MGLTPGVLRSALAAPDAESRYIRLRCHPAAAGVGIAEVRLLDPASSATPNAQVSHAARRVRRGVFPRAFLDEQTYWTVVGAPGSSLEALLSEDAAVEIAKRGYSIEPFITTTEGLLTWADGQATHSLERGSLPIPSVTRRHPGLTLTTTALVAGSDADSTLVILYDLANTSGQASNVGLHLALRPFQVNPPWQRLNFEGGVARPEPLSAEPAGLRVGRLLVEPLAPGWTARTSTWDAGDVAEWLEAGTIPPAAPPQSSPHSSGVLSYDLSIPPGESRRVALRVVLEGRDTSGLTPGEGWQASADALRSAIADQWDQRLSAVRLTVPAADAWIADTFRSQIAYVLINRDGPALQPGSRSYERSWARDGSMTSAALLECGLIEPAVAWADWYGPYQFDSGKVPCVVDARGPDPVPEHDSHGEYIWAVANCFRHTRDRAFLDRHWPRVLKAADYIRSIRAERMTPEYQSGPRRAFFGLVPESISHEGYSAKPMHSYWDCLFTLLGLKEAAFIAAELGHADDAARLAALAADFRRTLVDSIRFVAAEKGLSFIPGCAELGDFDSTSTTIVGFPCDEIDAVPPDLLAGTFDRYWSWFRQRRDSDDWDAYTPYELRHVGLLARLGHPDRACEVLRWYAQHQRPAGWNHWAEVVTRDPRSPRFVGDMPHTWVGSDFLNAVRAIFLYEKGDSLVAFAGVPSGWVASGEQVGFDGLMTVYGTISGRLRRQGDTVTVRLWSDAPRRVDVRVPVPPGCSGQPAVAAALPFEATFEVR